MPTQGRSSLSYKLIALTTVSLLAVFCIIAGASWISASRFFDKAGSSIYRLLDEELVQTEDIIRSTLERKGLGLVQFLSQIAGLEIISFDHEALQGHLENVIKDEDVVYALYMIDLDNTIISRHRHEELQANHPHPHPATSSKELRQHMTDKQVVIEYTSDITYSGKKVGTIVVGISQKALFKLRGSAQERTEVIQRQLAEEIALFLRTLNTSIILICAVALFIIGGFLYIVLKKIIIDRLVEMSKAFLKVSQGDLNSQVGQVSNDELGDLCQSFNNMTSSLQKVTVSRDNLEEAHQKLQQAQEQLAQSLQELEASHEFSNQLIEKSPAGIMVLDNRKRIQEINIAGCRILGRNRQDLLGSDIQSIQQDVSSLTPLKHMGPEGTLPHEETFLGIDGNTVPVLINTTEIQSEAREDIVLATFVDISARKRAEEKLRTVSVTDELTGLMNRRGFMSMACKQLKIAERAQSNLFLLFADLDNMKWINDTFGHSAGDKALQETAALFEKTFRKSDIYGRLGGDEFAVLLTTETGSEDEKVIRQRLKENLLHLNSEKGRDFNLEISVGIVGFHHNDPVDLEELMQRADDKMYERKAIRKKRSQTS